MKLLHLHIESPSLSARRFTRIAFGVALLLVAIPAYVTPVLAADDPPVFLLKWGSHGTGTSQFDEPWGIAVDPDGNVWVADFQNSRVRKFSSEGDYLAGWGYGSNAGEFKYPIGAASDSDGNIYVTDRDNYRVQKYEADTETWSVFASGFGMPAGIAVAGDGQVFVVDSSDKHVEVYDSSGTYLTQFGAPGTGDGQFYGASAIAVDSGGAVYVADSGIEAGDPSRVQKFVWDPEVEPGGAYVYDTQFSSNGSDDGQSLGIYGIVVDPAGGVYITDCYNHRVQKFTYNDVSASYEFALKWGTFGTDDGLFRLPTGIALHPNGNIYVTEFGGDRVQAFTYRTVTITLKTGWNMVSVPVTLDPENNSPADVFPGAVAVYTWNAGNKSYEVPLTIEPECGYWVAVTGDTTITLTGALVTSWSDHPLFAGWNMVGSVSGAPVAVGDLDDGSTGAVLTNSIYCWNPTGKCYDCSSDIQEGLGYWVATTQNCTLAMTAPVGRGAPPHPSRYGVAVPIFSLPCAQTCIRSMLQRRPLSHAARACACMSSTY
jgi:DNA-binding beta-propeller fold protein YncE